jgi:hypothetical protein
MWSYTLSVNDRKMNLTGLFSKLNATSKFIFIYSNSSKSLLFEPKNEMSTKLADYYDYLTCNGSQSIKTIVFRMTGSSSTKVYTLSESARIRMDRGGTTVSFSMI